MWPSIVNSLGLVFDIIGVVMLFKYGLPEEVSRSGAGFLQLEEDDKDEVAKAARYDTLSRVALGLLVAGFLLQIVSNWM